MTQAALPERIFIVATLALAVYLAAFLYCATIGHGRRKRTFAQRPTTTFREWCQRHYADLSEQQWKHVEQVVAVFAQEIGVHVTQLEPGDVILDSYCVKGMCSHFDDTWEAWTEKLAVYVRKARGNAISCEEGILSSSWVTLDDVIRGTIFMVSESAIRDQSVLGDRSPP